MGILRISAVWGQEEVHGNLVRVGPRSCQEFRMHRNEMIGEVGFEQANSFDQSFVATRGQGACNGDDGVMPRFSPMTTTTGCRNAHCIAAVKPPWMDTGGRGRVGSAASKANLLPIGLHQSPASHSDFTTYTNLHRAQPRFHEIPT